jgi:hypothetical protein
VVGEAGFLMRTEEFYHEGVENPFFREDDLNRMILEPWQVDILNEEIRRGKVDVNREFISDVTGEAMIEYCEHDGRVYMLDFAIVKGD